MTTIDPKGRNFYPFLPVGRSQVINIQDDCVVVKCDGYVSSIPNLPDIPDWFCGYCAIKKDKLPNAWWGDYEADGIEFLNVHGGITYAKLEGDWAVFGFDCSHHNDANNPNCQDPNWVMAQAKQLETLLLAYAERIVEWRQANRERRIEILEEVNSLGEVSNDLGFGAMLSALFGAKSLGPNEEEAEQIKIELNSLFDDLNLGNLFGEEE